MSFFNILYISCRGDLSFGVEQKSGVELFDDHTRIIRKLDLRKNRFRKYRFLSVDVTRNCHFPDASSLHGVVVGGSPAMLSEGMPEWGLLLQNFLFTLIDKKVPVLGICFGHQFLAKILGADVVKLKNYREFGSREVCLTRRGMDDLLFDGVSKKFEAWMSHSDSVVRVSESVVRLASNGYCDNQAVLFRENVYGVQFHPEIETSILMNLFNLRSDKISAEGLSLSKILKRYMRESGVGKQVLANFILKIVPRATVGFGLPARRSLCLKK